MEIEEIVVEETYYERRKKERPCDDESRRDALSEAGKACQAEPACDSASDACEEEDGFWGCQNPWPDDYEDDVDDEYDGESAVSGYNRKLGMRGEIAAARYLERLDYEILERNWTCPFGEADIIARDGATLVFIEVKTRTGVSKGFPSEAVDARKRARYEKIAAWYLKDHDEFDIPVRFDVVALLVIAKDRAFMKHYVNAFGVGL